MVETIVNMLLSVFAYVVSWWQTIMDSTGLFGLVLGCIGAFFLMRLVLSSVLGRFVGGTFLGSDIVRKKIKSRRSDDG